STGLPRPSGSALVWHRPTYASGLHFSGFAPSLRLPPPWSFVTPAPPWLPGYTPLRRSPAPSALPRPSGSSSSPWLIGSPSPPWAPPPLAPPLSPFFTHGSSFLSSPWLFLFPLWLLHLLSPPRTLFVILPGIRPPPESPPKFPLMPPSVVVYGVRMHLLGGEWYIKIMDLCCGVLPLFLFLFFLI
ncbi:hypothetical protein M9458_029562, partial [Cirrhinus mrigala]